MKFLKVYLFILLLFIAAGEMRPQNMPGKMFGLTIDDVGNETVILQQLRRFKTVSKGDYVPVVRIVFDVDDDKPLIVPSRYKSVIQKIKQEKLAIVMGEILDSQFVYKCRNRQISFKQCYVQRAGNFFEQLNKDDSGILVDIWEIGNEVNGEWTGWKKEEWKDDDVTVRDMLANRLEVAEAVAEANALIKNKGGKTALTLYLNQDTQGKHSWENEPKKMSRTDKREIAYGENFGMFNWWDAYKNKFRDDADGKYRNTDYVFISYWQDDNFEVLPAEWFNIFLRLHGDVPGAKLGFGEVGVQCYKECRIGGEDTCEAKKDGKKYIKHLERRCQCCLDSQKPYILRYYSEWNKEIRYLVENSKNESFKDRFAGGYFYWQFNDDVLNKFVWAAEKTTKKSEQDELRTEAEGTSQNLLNIYQDWQN